MRANSIKGQSSKWQATIPLQNMEALLVRKLGELFKH